MSLTVRPVEPRDAAFVERLLMDNWHGLGVTAKGRIYDVPSLPALVAELDGNPTGLIAYDIAGDELCVVVVDAGQPGRGIGDALMRAAFAEARARGLRRAWLTTSNENIAALRFYLRLGMRLVAVHLGAVDDARRRLKPSIPTHSPDGVAVQDEWECELDLTQPAAAGA